VEHWALKYLPKLPTLEALFNKEINPELNTKDEYQSRTLTLKLMLLIEFIISPISKFNWHTC